MPEFTPITTQEQLDALIGERIKRERETLAKKYADYDELKAKVADSEKQIGDLSRSLEDSAKKHAGVDQKLAEMQSKLKGYESHSVKTRIAHEAGIPYELIDRLSGESEEDIRKDAESLAKFIGKGGTQTAPLKSTEQDGADTKTAALRALTNQLTNKGE